MKRVTKSSKRSNPAKPVLNDMVGARIEYVHAEPYGYSPMIEIGTIVEIKERWDGLHMLVQPDNKNLIAKWRVAEHHLRRYVYEPAVVAATITETEKAANNAA